MANRVTGMYSNMDTESLIQDLVKAKSYKVDKLNKDKTKLEWKQDAWNGLNKELKTLFNGTVNKLRWASSYKKKTTSVSNDKAVSVITGESAMNSVQNLSIKKLASSGYLTGAKVNTASGEQASGSTLIKDMALKDADGNLVEGFAGITGSGSFSITAGGKTTSITIDDTTTIEGLVKQLNSAGVNANFDEKNQRLFIGASTSGTDADFSITADNANGFAAMSLMGINVASDTGASESYGKLASLYSEVKDMSDDEAVDYITSDTSSELYKMLKAEMNGNDDTDYDAAYAKLKDKLSFADNVSGTDAKFYSEGAVRLHGSDAEIELNGVSFKSSSNTIEVNGLSFTCNSVAEDITITTKDDTDGIYDMVRDFLKEYNTIINKIDSLYNAEVAKGYEPLTEEEKDALSDKEVEKYEQKIKDSILRRDTSLGTLFEGLRNTMSAGVEVNGKTMYLSDFGINTPSYLETAAGARNAYHIDGDDKDEVTSGNADKLKTMIAGDPDTVVSFFTGLARDLYSKMDGLSAKSSYSSYGSFYDDIQMKSDLDDYKSKISDAEAKLADFEDRYYDKFSAMEVALSKLQSNNNYLSGLFS